VENAAARLIGAVTEHPSAGHAPCQGSLVEIAVVDASPVYRYSLMPVRELNDRQRPVRMTTQPRVRTVVIGLMTTTASAFPTLAHGLATLDAFPIAGALQIAPDQPGVDFDALERARAVLVQAWRNDLTPDEITVTPQGGVTIAWRRAGWALELIVDPFALSAFRLDSPSKMVEWTRAGSEATVADAKAALAAMAGDKARPQAAAS